MSLDSKHNELAKLSGGIINYDKINLSLLTAHSTRIEGSTLSNEEVLNLIENDQVTEKVTFLNHLMVKDYQDALNEILK